MVPRRLADADRAPAFTLRGDDGDKHPLRELLATRLVLYFYPADFTPGCTSEARDFAARWRAFTALSTAVVGVSPDSVASHQQFRADENLPFLLLSDPDHAVMTRYGAYGQKMLYGKSVTGVIRSTFVIGTNGRIEHAWYNVRATGHAERVLAALS